MKKTEIRISGLGGQGVVLAGQILGKAAVYDGKNAVQTQSYGAEARGSAAKSEVIISNSKIGFPEVRKCDILVAMSQEAVEKYFKDLKKNGILIVDSTYVKKIPETMTKAFKIPATGESEKTFKTNTYANIVMLGALTKILGTINENSFQKAIEDTFTKEPANVNKLAYRKGMQLVM